MLDPFYPITDAHPSASLLRPPHLDATVPVLFARICFGFSVSHSRSPFHEFYSRQCTYTLMCMGCHRLCPRVSLSCFCFCVFFSFLISCLVLHHHPSSRLVSHILVLSFPTSPQRLPLISSSSSSSRLVSSHSRSCLFSCVCLCPPIPRLVSHLSSCLTTSLHLPPSPHLASVSHPRLLTVLCLYCTLYHHHPSTSTSPSPLFPCHPATEHSLYSILIFQSRFQTRLISRISNICVPSSS